MNLTSFNTLIVVQTTSIFLVMLVPVGILTAVAERVNEFKRLSLEKQRLSMMISKTGFSKNTRVTPGKFND